ncbi:MAG: hypothetical protein IPN36_13625 [Bacteroidetes bacterium]|nr:hypothetical protein [Bacteroidota bacterium]
MKRAITYTLGSLLAFTIMLCVFSIAKSEEDINRCLVKYRSEWSKPCSQCQDYSKSYRAYFRNECKENLDVKVASQEADKRWKTFSRLNMQPGDSIVAYACKGTGKYLYWVRKAGDAVIVFPTDEEINNQYAK